MLNAYEKLLIYAEKSGVMVKEINFKTNKKFGLTVGDFIYINNNLNTKEKYCILAEELGHFKTGSSNIINLKDIRNKKNELVARKWGYEKIVPPHKLLKLYDEGMRFDYEFAEALDITVDILREAVNYYKCRGIDI